MKILFMSQMPPHSNQQSGNQSSAAVEQLRQQIQLNEQQQASNNSGSYLASSADFFSYLLPANSTLQGGGAGEISFEESVILDNLIMNEFDLLDGEDALLGGGGPGDFKFEEASELITGEIGCDEASTLLLTNPPAYSATVPASTTQQQQQVSYSSQTNTFGLTSDAFGNYGQSNTHMTSSAHCMTNATTIPNSNNHALNENQHHQRMTTTPSANILDTKHIKQEYSYHEDSNSSSATYKSEPANMTSSSQRYFDPATAFNFNPLSVSSSVEPSTSGLAYRRSHTKKQQSEEITYGPITVRPRKNPAPTLASGRKSKNIELSDDEARKREIRRQRNRNAAEKCKQKRAEIEEDLHSKAKRLRDEQVALARENEKLMAKKRRLEEMLETHTCRRSGADRSNQQAVTYQQTYQAPYNTNTTGLPQPLAQAYPSANMMPMGSYSTTSGYEMAPQPHLVQQQQQQPQLTQSPYLHQRPQPSASVAMATNQSTAYNIQPQPQQQFYQNQMYTPQYN